MNSRKLELFPWMFKPFHTISMINPKKKCWFTCEEHATKYINLSSKVQTYVTLEESGDDLVLPIPQELLTKLRWNTGDVLQWHVELDNTNDIEETTWTMKVNKTNGIVG